VNTPSAVDASSQPKEPDLAAPRRREKQTTWSRLASDVVAAAELAEELEDDLEALRRELVDSRKAQRRAEQERDEAVEARFTARTVLEALTLAEACFPDRLVVLPSARASADSSPFSDPARIFESLSLLAFFGRHDGDFEAILQKVMGVQARWRPRDSPETTARFGAQRTWAGRDGARKLFRRHITVGHGVDAQRCAQIYYDIASDGPRRARVGRRAPADHQRGRLISWSSWCGTMAASPVEAAMRMSRLLARRPRRPRRPDEGAQPRPVLPGVAVGWRRSASTGAAQLSVRGAVRPNSESIGCQVGGTTSTSLTASSMVARMVSRPADPLDRRLVTSSGRSSIAGRTPAATAVSAARSATSGWSTAKPCSHAAWQPSAVK
jgi:hypothetical protein